MKPQHIGLFEGIGGFTLAAQWAGYETPVMVEWNPYCQQVLQKNFPNATIHGDIHHFDGRPYRGHFHVLTGGFPCQPYSHAGRREGNDDHRALWPQMLRVITEIAPPWVIGENVAGLLTMDRGRVLLGILTDLENAGYRSIEIYTIPALALGAPHERERIWIVAHRDDLQCHRSGRTWGRRHEPTDENSGLVAHPDNWRTRSESREAGDQRRAGSEDRPESLRQTHRQTGTSWAQSTSADNVGHTTHSDSHWQQQPQRTLQEVRRRPADENNQHPPHPHLQRCQQQLPPGEPGSPGFHTRSHDTQWHEHWLPVATRLCRVDDGLPTRLDGTGHLPTPPQKTKASGRAHRLEALGNAIVPHIAYQIFQAINQYDKTLSS